MNKKYQITDEKQAIDLLKKIVDGQLELSPNDLEFVNFASFTMHLEGTKFDKTITPSIMKGLLGLQTEINRAYALLKYNTPDTKQLTKDERENLEIIVEVEKGSSNLEINIQDLLLKFVELTGGAMEPTHTVIIVLGVAGLYFGHVALRNYLDYRRQIREQEIKSESDKKIIENLKFSSEEETKRLAIIKEIVAKDDRIANLETFAYNAHTSLVKAASNADKSSLQGVDIDGAVAKTLTQNARRESTDFRLDGEYMLLKVDATNTDKFRVTIQNSGTSDTIDAIVQDDTLTQNFKSTLQEAEWQRKPVKLKINGRKVGGQIVSAIIIDVEEI